MTTMNFRHRIRARSTKFFALAMALAFLAAATLLLPSAQAGSLGFSIENGDPSSLQVTVLDEQTLAPVVDAQIEVNSLGNASTSSGDWVAADTLKAVTVSKPGYVTMTIAGVRGGHLTVHLKRLEISVAEVIASGTVGGWSMPAHVQSPRESGDSGEPGALAKPIALGLVIRSLSGLDLLDFTLQSVVSPLNDTINIWGDREIPSNLVLPPQSIPLLIGSAKVNKLNYRLPVPSGISSRLGVIQGKMMSNDLISIGQSGELSLSSLNKFEFTRVGLAATVTPNSDFRQDVSADTALSPTHSVSVTAAPFAADVMVAAFTNLYSDRSVMVPTDLKTPISASLSVGPLADATTSVLLKSMAPLQGSTREIVGIALSPDNRKIAGVMVEQASAQLQLPTFLPTPELADSLRLPATIRLPAAKQGLSSALFEAPRPKAGPTPPGSATYPVWMVMSLPEAGALSISTQTLGTNAASIRSISLATMEFSPDFDETRIDGLTAIQGLRRFSRVNAKIGN